MALLADAPLEDLDALLGNPLTQQVREGFAGLLGSARFDEAGRRRSSGELGRQGDSGAGGDAVPAPEAPWSPALHPSPKKCSVLPLTPPLGPLPVLRQGASASAGALPSLGGAAVATPFGPRRPAQGLSRGQMRYPQYPPLLLGAASGVLRSTRSTWSLQKQPPPPLDPVTPPSAAAAAAVAAVVAEQHQQSQQAAAATATATAVRAEEPAARAPAAPEVQGPRSPAAVAASGGAAPGGEAPRSPKDRRSGSKLSPEAAVERRRRSSSISVLRERSPELTHQSGGSTGSGAASPVAVAAAKESRASFEEAPEVLLPDDVKGRRSSISIVVLEKGSSPSSGALGKRGSTGTSPRWSLEDDFTDSLAASVDKTEASVEMASMRSTQPINTPVWGPMTDVVHEAVEKAGANATAYLKSIHPQDEEQLSPEEKLKRRLQKGKVEPWNTRGKNAVGLAPKLNALRKANTSMSPRDEQDQDSGSRPESSHSSSKAPRSPSAQEPAAGSGRRSPSCPSGGALGYGARDGGGGGDALADTVEAPSAAPSPKPGKSARATFAAACTIHSLCRKALHHKDGDGRSRSKTSRRNLMVEEDKSAETASPLSLRGKSPKRMATKILRESLLEEEPEEQSALMHGCLCCTNDTVEGLLAKAEQLQSADELASGSLHATVHVAARSLAVIEKKAFHLGNLKDRRDVFAHCLEQRGELLAKAWELGQNSNLGAEAAGFRKFVASCVHKDGASDGRPQDADKSDFFAFLKTFGLPADHEAVLEAKQLLKEGAEQWASTALEMAQEKASLVLIPEEDRYEVDCPAKPGVEVDQVVEIYSGVVALRALALKAGNLNGKEYASPFLKELEDLLKRVAIQIIINRLNLGVEQIVAADERLAQEAVDNPKIGGRGAVLHSERVQALIDQALEKGAPSNHPGVKEARLRIQDLRAEAVRRDAMKLIHEDAEQFRTKGWIPEAATKCADTVEKMIAKAEKESIPREHPKLRAAWLASKELREQEGFRKREAHAEKRRAEAEAKQSSSG